MCKIIFEPDTIKEWLNTLVITKPEFWKKTVREYSYGKDVIVECFTSHADRDFFSVVSEALDVLCHTMENLSSDVTAQLCQTGSNRTTFDITFYWEELYR